MGAPARGAVFPWATLAVNVAGCLAIRALWAWNGRSPLPPAVGALVFVGLIGAFTTFSTFAFEAVALARSGAVGAALLYVGASNGLGLLAVSLGSAAVRALAPALPR